MKQLLYLIFLLCATIEMAIAQPVKTVFGFATQQYNPSVTEFKIIEGPRGPRGLQGIQGIPGKTDTVLFEPVLDNYLTANETSEVLDYALYPIHKNIDSLKYITRAIHGNATHRMNYIEYNLNIHKLRASGRTKILSGIGLQVIAAGILVASEIETTTVVNVMTKYEIPYSYTEYQTHNVITNTQTIIPANPKPHGHSHNNNSVVVITQNTQQVINPVNKTGTIDFTVNDLAPMVQEYNKTPFYISAVILASAGVVMEILGIIDIHKANIYATSNSVGIKYSF